MNLQRNSNETDFSTEETDDKTEEATDENGEETCSPHISERVNKYNKYKMKKLLKKYVKDFNRLIKKEKQKKDKESFEKVLSKSLSSSSSSSNISSKREKSQYFCVELQNEMFKGFQLINSFANEDVGDRKYAFSTGNDSTLNEYLELVKSVVKISPEDVYTYYSYERDDTSKDAISLTDSLNDFPTNHYNYSSDGNDGSMNDEIVGGQTNEQQKVDEITDETSCFDISHNYFETLKETSPIVLSADPKVYSRSDILNKTYEIVDENYNSSSRNELKFTIHIEPNEVEHSNLIEHHSITLENKNVNDLPLIPMLLQEKSGSSIITFSRKSSDHNFLISGDEFEEKILEVDDEQLPKSQRQHNNKVEEVSFEVNNTSRITSDFLFQPNDKLPSVNIINFDMRNGRLIKVPNSTSTVNSSNMKESEFHKMETLVNSLSDKTTININNSSDKEDSLTWLAYLNRNSLSTENNCESKEKLNKIFDVPRDTNTSAKSSSKTANNISKTTVKIYNERGKNSTERMRSQDQTRLSLPDRRSRRRRKRKGQNSSVSSRRRSISSESNSSHSSTGTRISSKRVSKNNGIKNSKSSSSGYSYSSMSSTESESISKSEDKKEKRSKSRKSSADIKRSSSDKSTGIISKKRNKSEKDPSINLPPSRIPSKPLTKFDHESDTSNAKISKGNLPANSNNKMKDINPSDSLSKLSKKSNKINSGTTLKDELFETNQSKSRKKDSVEKVNSKPLLSSKQSKTQTKSKGLENDVGGNEVSLPPHMKSFVGRRTDNRSIKSGKSFSPDSKQFTKVLLHKPSTNTMVSTKESLPDSSEYTDTTSGNYKQSSPSRTFKKFYMESEIVRESVGSPTSEKTSKVPDKQSKTAKSATTVNLEKNKSSKSSLTKNRSKSKSKTMPKYKVADSLNISNDQLEENMLKPFTLRGITKEEVMELFKFYESQKMAKRWIILALLCCLLNPPFGILAVLLNLLSIKSEELKRTRNAILYAKYAWTVSVIGCVLTVLTATNVEELVFNLFR
ncbi:hypothetical protein SNEBB_004083 [Seison nebaliae]|nr:hypothetical protein SNEBB_004083 [Seison nebaliae]